jgi:hypothetical protein
MSRFPGLSRAEFEAFLRAFTQPGTLVFRNNKWLGLNRNGKSYTVHVRHGGSRKYDASLVEVVAKDLGVSLQEFKDWYEKR